MNNEEEMRAKFAAIGARYLARTANELGQLEKLVEQLSTGGQSTIKEIEILSHRIRGSGAVFGFAALSEAAGVIEMLAVDGELADHADTAQLTAQFTAQLKRLHTETQNALAAAKIA